MAIELFEAARDGVIRYRRRKRMLKYTLGNEFSEQIVSEFTGIGPVSPSHSPKKEKPKDDWWDFPF